MDYIHFFGNTGDKSLMFSGAFRPGGLLLSLQGKRILIDPGPGTFCEFVKSYPNSIQSIDAIVLSHVHFDHSTDINAMIEGMTDGGKKKRGALITSSYCYSGDQKVILDYVKGSILNVYLADENDQVIIGDIGVKAYKHSHGTPTYGFSFCTNSKKVSYISDTAYFNDLRNYYMGSNIVVINVPYYQFPEGKQPKHLCVLDVIDIIKAIKPEKAIISHFGSSIIEEGVGPVVELLTKKTGVSVLAATVGEIYTIE